MTCLFLYTIDAKNFPSHNFANVLANFFSDLLLILMDVRYFSAFFIYSLYFAIFDSIISSKFLDFTSSGSLATCNLSNILVFYHQLFVYLTVKPSTNIVLTNSFYPFFNSIKLDQKNYSGYSPSVISDFR